jgi:hypothetical protein
MDEPSPDPVLAPPGSDPAANGVPELDLAVVPDLVLVVAADDAPIDSTFAEKERRLLTHPLYASWRPPGECRNFLALANVSYFFGCRHPPVVSDMLLALDVDPAGLAETKEGRCYYQWLMGNSPDVIVEIVSAKSGGENGQKMRACALPHVPYYIIFDPENILGRGMLRAFTAWPEDYQPIDPAWLPGVGLGLALWEGEFEGLRRTWLRWCDRDGRLIPTGAERAEAAEQRAEEASRKLRELEAKLRAQGIDPNA